MCYSSPPLKFNSVLEISSLVPILDITLRGFFPPDFVDIVWNCQKPGLAPLKKSKFKARIISQISRDSLARDTINVTPQHNCSPPNIHADLTRKKQPDVTPPNRNGGDIQERMTSCTLSSIRCLTPKTYDKNKIHDTTTLHLHKTCVSTYLLIP